MARFGPHSAAELRRREPRPGRTWHLDEMATRVGGRQDQGQTLDVLVQERRDTAVAVRFLRRPPAVADGVAPSRIATDRLGSDAAATGRLPELREPRAAAHGQVRAAVRCNDRVEQARYPTRGRECGMCRFETPASTQRFLGA